ncbi:hypothetical protein [Vibrio gangliei]|uniref:hypothetical protein n=1 Tax=Vibrio gangliei TaxID=2077090 RepID=UPI000D01F46D|nr:hypothetical protein [Vibrio gangliei]
MAAEKLTKARLVQIIIIFSVLVTAFTWRTIEHKQPSNSDNSCQINQHCELNIAPLYAKLVVEKVSKDNLTIQLQPIDLEEKSSESTLSLKSLSDENKILPVDTNKWQVTLSPNQPKSNWSVISNGKEIYKFELNHLD